MHGVKGREKNSYKEICRELGVGWIKDGYNMAMVKVFL